MELNIHIIAILGIFSSLLLCEEAALSPRDSDGQMAPQFKNTGGDHTCDEDCRRNKRRRIMKQTKVYFGAVRSGAVTERDERVYLMPYRMLADYNRDELPMGSDPTPVEIEIDIQDINDINEQTMDFSVRCHLKHWYQDPRIKFPQNTTNNIKSIKLSAIDLATELWVPDITFVNGKDPQALDPQYMTEHNTLGRLSSSGGIYFVRELDLKFKCEMDLQNYPFDVQHCEITMESFKYSMEEMYFREVRVRAKKVRLDDFTLEKYESINCTDTDGGSSATPCHSVSLTLRRQVGYFILQIYSPSILVVVLSWIIFWIEMDSGNQMNLLILLVLTISTLNYGSQTSLPRVSYIKAIDVWFQGCLVFVCMALLEAAFVSYITNNSDEQTDRRTEKTSYPWKTADTIVDVEINGSIPGDKWDKSKISRGGRIHKLSRWVFPLMFLVFNAVYFLYFIHLK